MSSSFSATPMVLTGLVASGGISIFTPGFLLSKSKYKSAYKYSTRGFSMSGSSTPGIVMPSYLTTTTGIEMSMLVSISDMVSALPSSSTPVFTYALVG